MSPLDLLRAAWTAYSFAATLSLVGGAGLIALGLLASAWLPGFIRKPLICAGTAIVVLAVVYQAGSARGAHEAAVANAAAALKAEATRRANAEYVMNKIAAQAAQDLETLSESNKRLKDLNDALSKDKDRDRQCVDRDTARRLRQL